MSLLVGNHASNKQGGRMANNFTVGSVVRNFGTTAKVVGFFAAADGKPCDQTGWPILKALRADGKARGGKWVADPSKCEAMPRTFASFDRNGNDCVMTVPE
jgi:hypothetical protein